MTMAIRRNVLGFPFAVALVLSILLLLPAVRGNSDSDALSALRRSLSDPDNRLSSWDPNLVDPCTWIYVTCNSDQRVTRLDLGMNNLSGELVPELGNLEFLQYLELYRNNIHGTIPAELGKLKNLIALDLYNNNFSGSVPPELAGLTSLVFLRLNDNPQLTGTFPAPIASLPNLKVVDVSNTNLSGYNPPGAFI